MKELKWGWVLGEFKDGSYLPIMFFQCSLTLKKKNRLFNLIEVNGKPCDQKIDPGGIYPDFTT